MRTLLLLLACLTACSLKVDYTGTYYQCNPDGACPDGYECQDKVCIPTDPVPPACSVDVAAGAGHACAVREGGAVWCWGRNDKGQLGDGTTTDSDVPVQANGVASAVAVGAGDAFSCALDTSGNVFCWGANESGELGDGSMGDSRVPVQVAGVTGAKALSVGSTHSCVITANDTVMCWGNNDAGQIGDGSTTTRQSPTSVSTPPTKAIAAGYNHTCAVDMSGGLRCWGENDHGEVGVGDTDMHTTPTVVMDLTNVTKVAVGDDLTCAITDGFPYCWGYNANGQVGNPTVSGTVLRPVPVLAPAPMVDIKGGDEHTCGVDGQGNLYCWGLNTDGRLGDGSILSRYAPALSLFNDTVAFSLGGEHTCAVDSTGAIRCAGFNRRGQLGDGRRVTEGEPVQVDGITNAKFVVSGGSHSCAALEDGRVMCWGANQVGQCGDGGFSPTRTLPVEVKGLTNPTVLAAGADHTCALTEDKAVYCWGGNADGRLGDVSGQPSAQPLYTGFRGTANKLSLGDASTCVVQTDGAPLCLGNLFGTSPSNPIGFTSATAVAVGSNFSCVLKTDGTATCSAQNNYVGQLGNGLQDASTGPSDPIGITGATDIFARGGAACALAGGALKCWGFNGARLGVGMDSYAVLTPTPVMGLSSIAEFSMGFDNSCARKTDDSVWCWGVGAYGGVGDNSYSDRNSPVQITSVSGAKSVGAGGDHVCAVKADGTVWCWGLDVSGQLGIGIRQIIRPVGVQMSCN